MSNEQPTPTTKTPEEQYLSDLHNMQWYLTSGAQLALGQPTFERRTDEMARVVGHESGTLAAQSFGQDPETSPLKDIFSRASYDAGEAFAPVFDQEGHKLPASTDDEARAQKDAYNT